MSLKFMQLVNLNNISGDHKLSGIDYFKTPKSGYEKEMILTCVSSLIMKNILSKENILVLEC